MERLLARVTIGVTAAALAIALVLPIVPGRSRASASPASPTGRIVFASDADGDFELYLMRADGSGRRQLTDNKVDDTSPAWAPGGGRIVFERESRKGERFEDLFILDLYTEKETPWLVHTVSDEGDAEWSPNGKWIAYRGEDGGDGSSVIAQRVDGSDKRYISSAQENSQNLDPSWSPDGKKVAVVDAYDQSDVYVARFCCSDGYRKHRVTTQDSYWKTDVDWSPAGSCLLYTGVGDDDSALFVASSTADHPQRIIYWNKSHLHAGGWSPDGRHILFTSDRRGSNDIYMTTRAGEDVRRLTTSSHNEITPAWYGRVRDPRPCGGSREEPEPEPSPSGSPSPSPSLTLPLP